MIVTGLNILGGGPGSDAYVERLTVMYVSPSMPGLLPVNPPPGQLVSHAYYLLLIFMNIQFNK